jgi:hypothetical protein
MRQLIFVACLFACSSLSSSARAADGGSGNGLLDLAEFAQDLALNGGSVDDDAGSGFTPADAGSVGGTAPTPTVQAPTTPIVRGCEYAGDVPMSSVAPIALCVMALLLARRRRIV